MKVTDEKALVKQELIWDLVEKRPLKYQYKVFVQKFLTTGSPGDAAELSGFTRGYGYCLLQKPEINAAIQEFLESDEFVMDRGERFRWWTAVTRGMVPGFDSRARLKASELLAKAAGDFDDAVKIQINNLQQNTGPTLDMTKLTDEQLTQMYAILDSVDDG